MSSGHLSYLLLLLFQSTLLVSAAMLMAWLWSLKVGRTGIVDVVWCALFIPIALSYAALGDGYELRRGMIAIMVCAWSLRLSSHLLRRLRDPATGRLGDDPRYAELRRKWGDRADGKTLMLFLLQACLNILLSLPFALVCLNPSREISPWECAGAVLWALGLFGEATADRQLRRFKADSSNRGKTLASGLWRFSRHPNYFFEWVIWCGFFVFALGTPMGWATVYCPAIVYHLLNRVTGIPMNEEQAGRTRGDYRAYQERTSRFFPWHPKRA